MGKLSKVLFIDFEFNRIVEPRVNLVCCVTTDLKTLKVNKFWLHKDAYANKMLRNHINKYDTIIGYSTVAEARSFISLGLNPLDFKWIDLFIEYRFITNHNDKLLWGKQLVDGKVKPVRKPPPKWERSEEDSKSSFRPTHSLAEATFKLTGEIRNIKEKEEVRNLIISAPEKFTSAERKRILEYCADDVIFMPKIWERIKEELKVLDKKVDMQEYFDEALLRGRYSAHTAIMENLGYPIDVEKTKNFSRQVNTILFECQKEINSFFPEIKPFRWNRPKQRFSQNQASIKAWIRENHDTNKWMKTDTDELSLSLDAFQRFYDFKHQYPQDNFGAQMVRYAKLKQSLYGFSESTKKETFWDSVGSDGRARPYMNHYGAQSSRSQPGARGFMFLKPAWMRALVVPKPGMFMASIDYGQQEFFIAALKSEDRNMIDAYLSGDPYLYGAKLARVIPMSATKESHKLVRDVFKNTYLGILFGMTKYGLAIKLTQDTGRTYTEEDAQAEIDRFADTFPKYMEYKESIASEYEDKGSITLPCGWRMWGDNENIRSVANVPIQGTGASVMRKSVDLAVERDVKILFTLHDANYMEDYIGNEDKILKLRDSMREAFVFYFPNRLKKYAEQIKLDPYAWSPNYKKDSTLILKSWKVPTSNLYIDERSLTEYEKFSQYFTPGDAEFL